jgi:hypothetical protein
VFCNRSIAPATAQKILEKLLPTITGNLYGKTPVLTVTEYGSWYIERENDVALFENVHGREGDFSNRFLHLFTHLNFIKCEPSRYNPAGLRALFFK